MALKFFSDHTNTTGLEDLSLLKLRVLVVDDYADALELTCFVLEEYGIQVMKAASATEALQAIAQAVPDMIVSDISLPDRDGYSLIREIRNLPPEGGGQMPAIALTGFAQDEDTLAREAGFQLYLSKPIEPDELVASVAELSSAACKI